MGRRGDGPLADVTRFAGFSSPLRLARDPFLSREDKLSGLATWRDVVVRHLGGADLERRLRLVREIDRALGHLHKRSS